MRKRTNKNNTRRCKLLEIERRRWTKLGAKSNISLVLLLLTFFWTQRNNLKHETRKIASCAPSLPHIYIIQLITQQKRLLKKNSKTIFLVALFVFEDFFFLILDFCFLFFHLFLHSFVNFYFFPPCKYTIEYFWKATRRESVCVHIIIFFGLIFQMNAALKIKKTKSKASMLRDPTAESMAGSDP